MLEALEFNRVELFQALHLDRSCYELINLLFRFVCQEGATELQQYGLWLQKLVIELRTSHLFLYLSFSRVSGLPAIAYLYLWLLLGKLLSLLPPDGLIHWWLLLLKLSL